MSHHNDALQDVRSSELGIILSSSGLTMPMLLALPEDEQQRMLELVNRAVRRLPIEQLRAFDLSDRFEEQLETLAHHQGLNDEYLLTIEAQRREIEALQRQLHSSYYENATLQVEVERRNEAFGALSLAASLIREDASPVDDARWDQVLTSAYACGAATPTPAFPVEVAAPVFRPFAEVGDNVIQLPARRPVEAALTMPENESF